MQDNVFLFYAVTGAILAAATIYKIKRDLKNNPLKAVGFTAALALVPRNSERLLFGFVGLLILFAWPPLLAGLLYKERPRFCESIIVALLTAYALFFVFLPWLEPYVVSSGASWPAFALLLGLALLVVALIYILYVGGKPKEAAPEEPST